MVSYAEFGVPTERWPGAPPRVVAGSTAKVVGVVVGTLLHAELPVCAVVRDANNGAAWKAHRCTVSVVPDAANAEALAAAFAGAAGVFLMKRPNYNPASGLLDSRRGGCAGNRQGGSGKARAALDGRRPSHHVQPAELGRDARDGACRHGPPVALLGRLSSWRAPPGTCLQRARTASPATSSPSTIP